MLTDNNELPNTGADSVCVGITTYHDGVCAGVGDLTDMKNPIADEAAKSLRAGLPGAFGLAVVRKSYDPNWNKFAVLFPGNRSTEWFDTESEARKVANTFNNDSRQPSNPLHL